MKKLIVAASLALSLIAAPIPAHVEPLPLTASAAAAVPEMPAKCWNKKWRKKHKYACRHYSYWKRMVGEAD